MNQAAAITEIESSLIAEPGFAGKILIPGQGVYGIIVPPKAQSHHDATPWNKSTKIVDGARSFYDGEANTKAMAKAGSKLAQWALDLGLYIPSRDELELCYRRFKPTDDENYCWRGDNPSSVPVGYAYMPNDPAQSSIAEFKQGGAEAFEAAWYWTSTQYAGDESCAWVQYFDVGDQNGDHKGDDCRARAVRRVLINSVPQ